MLCYPIGFHDMSWTQSTKTHKLDWFFSRPGTWWWGRQTHILQRQDFFCIEIYTFHYTAFRCLVIVYPVMKSSSSESFLSLIFVLTEAWTNRPGLFLLSIYSATYLLNVWFYPPSYYQLLTLEATTFSVFSKRVFKIWKF